MAKVKEELGKKMLEKMGISEEELKGVEGLDPKVAYEQIMKNKEVKLKDKYEEMQGDLGKIIASFEEELTLNENIFEKGLKVEQAQGLTETEKLLQTKIQEANESYKAKVQNKVDQLQKELMDKWQEENSTLEQEIQTLQEKQKEEFNKREDVAAFNETEEENLQKLKELRVFNNYLEQRIFPIKFNLDAAADNKPVLQFFIDTLKIHKENEELKKLVDDKND